MRSLLRTIHPAPRTNCYGASCATAYSCVMPEHAPKLPPGPRLPRPLQASRWLFAPIPFMQACADRYGDPFTVRMTGLPPMVFFTDPSAIRQIFTGDSHQFRAGQANRVFKAILGPNSLLLLDGRRHKRERKLLMPPFHGARVRLYGEMMWEITDQSIDSWPVGAAFPIHPFLKDITLEVILRVVFGVDEGPRLARLRGLVRDALRILDGSNPLRNIWIWPRFASLRSNIRELLREEVQRRRAIPSNDRTDVMSLLVAARDEDGQPMTDEEIRDEMITLLVAGHESTAASLAWVIHRLLENPDVLAGAQAEMASVAGNGSDVSAPTPEQVASLTYLDAVIKETARVNPVVPVVVRQLTTDLQHRQHVTAGRLYRSTVHLSHSQAAGLVERARGVRPDPVSGWAGRSVYVLPVRRRRPPLRRRRVCHVRDEDRFGPGIVAPGATTGCRPRGSGRAARAATLPFSRSAGDHVAG